LQAAVELLPGVHTLLADNHQAEIERILSKYPPDQKRAAVLPLLYLAQHTYGCITEDAIDEIAALLELDPTQVGGLTGFYTLLHDKQEGKYRIQICTDLPCALRGAEAFAKEVCTNLGIQLGETTDDGLVTVEGVMCLAGCDKAPMFQLQDDEGIHYHENQDVSSTMGLIEELRQRGSDD
jgi:NADH-quinone oxidoreductase subunit E